MLAPRSRRLFFVLLLAAATSNCNCGQPPGGDDAGAVSSDASMPDSGAPEDIGPRRSPDAGPCQGEDGGVKNCTYLDQPCQLGACDPATGECVAHALDAVPCDDGDPCTAPDFCIEGVCESVALHCDTLGTECRPFICDPAGSGCIAAPLADDTPCANVDRCHASSSCQGGVCRGAAPVDCSRLDGVCQQGRCDLASGCVTHILAGSRCDDGDPCTPVDLCSDSGDCEPTTASCESQAAPCEVGRCVASTTTCHFSAAADNTPCDDNNACTRDDICTTGQCGGSDITCSGRDACHVAGCDAVTGCSVIALPDRSPCDDGDPNTAGDVCMSGVCAGQVLDCSRLDDACHQGRFDQTLQKCVAEVSNEGGSCDRDSNDCVVETCQSGLCLPVDATECAPCGPGAASGAASHFCRSGVCDAPTVTGGESFEGPSWPAGYSSGGSTAVASDWRISGDLALDGVQAARSGTLGDGETSELTLRVFSTGGSRLDFAFRVSSEEQTNLKAGDPLIVLVNDVEQMRSSGQRAWGRSEIFLGTPGYNTVTWRYQKDASISVGDDAVWIDDLRLSGLAAWVEDFDAGSWVDALPAGFSTSGWYVGSLSSGYEIRSMRLSQGISWLRYEFDAPRAGLLGFKLEFSVGYAGDFFALVLDGSEVRRYTTSMGSQYTTVAVGAGHHSFEWQHGHPSDIATLTSSVVDDVSFEPDPCF